MYQKSAGLFKAVCLILACCMLGGFWGCTTETPDLPDSTDEKDPEAEATEADTMADETDAPEPEVETPKKLGYKRITMKDDLKLANDTYTGNAVLNTEYPSGFHNTYLDVNLSFGGKVDISSGVKIAATKATSWDGIKIGVVDDGNLVVNFTTTNHTALTITPAEAGVTSFGDTFNLKFAMKMAEKENGKTDVTFSIWINNVLIRKDVAVSGMAGIGNFGGVLTWNGASVTVETPDTENDVAAPIPNYEDPPTSMGGKTWAGRFITSVDTQGKSTVISASDKNNGYRTTVDYSGFGLDYVMDFKVDRELKILQITDTQIIDAAQCRTADRLLDFQKANWDPKNMYNLVFRYIAKTVNETKPDLILLTGDVIYGEFDDKGTSLIALIHFMDSLQIPWAPVFGNHENESKMGVAWQCEQLGKSPYCLFVRRNGIGGNGNYSIGLARNGKLERVVYMMDSNGCSRSSSVNGSTVKTTVGFTNMQKQWLRESGLTVNEAAKKTIPSFVCYHIPTSEVLAAAIAAGYQSGADSASIKYTIGVDVPAKPGDSGYKGDLFEGIHSSVTLLQIMKQIGTDGAFFGHAHLNSTSVLYEGIRWTFGLKTGAYDKSPEIMGGTLITLANNSSTFTVEQVQTTARDIGMEYPGRVYRLPAVD